MVNDLRGFLEQHDASVTHVRREVELEDVGALTGQCEQTIVFENIKGYRGWKLVDLLFVNRAAQARVLGCEPREVVPRLAKVLERGPVKHRVVNDGPVKEIVLKGGDVDLSQIPVVTHTDRDAGPYITSFNVARDPETGVYNSMNPRALVVGRNRTLVSFVTRHVNAIYAKYKARGEKMPHAICIGTHPALELAAAYSGLHEDFWEMDFAGTILGEPVEMVRCESHDLVVPANAEVVLEGFVTLDDQGTDGPDPGPTTYFAPWYAPAPAFEVTAITMRRNPIYRNHQIVPYTDHQPLPRLFHEAQIYRWLRTSGLDVREVYFPPFGGALSCVIQLAPRMDGQVTDALLAVMGSPWANTKLVIAVDPDVDIYDAKELYHAIASRVDPSRDVIIVPNARGLPFDPSATPVEEAGEAAVAARFPSLVGKMGINATMPPAYRHNRKDFERGWPIHWGKVRLEDYL